MAHEFEVTALRLKAQRESTLLLTPAAFLIGLALGVFAIHFPLSERFTILFSVLALFTGSSLLVVNGFRQMLRQREIRLADHDLTD